MVVAGLVDIIIPPKVAAVAAVRGLFRLSPLLAGTP
jgi:hypothetical protein